MSETSTISLPLDKLILRLKADGFKIDVHTQLKMHEVLQKLGAQYLDHPNDLRFVLGPLVAKNQAEQERFDGVFKAYIKDVSSWESRISNPEPTPADSRNQQGRAWTRWIIPVSLLVALISILILYLQPEPVKPGASFSIPDTIVVGDTVRIENTTPELLDDSLSQLHDHQWEIGDSTVSEMHITHVFKKAGPIPVSLKVWHIEHPDIDSTNQYVVSVSCISKLDAQFVNIPNAIETGTPLSFATLISSDEGLLDYQWNFGDGTSSNLVSPQHTYSQARAYTIRLTVSRASNEGFDRVCDEVALTHTINVTEANEKVAMVIKSEIEPDTSEEFQLNPWVLFVIVLIGVLVYGVLEGYRYYREKHYIPESIQEKFKTSDSPPYKIPFPAQEEAFVPEPEFYTFADSLRQRDQGEYQVFDSRSTIKETIRKAGFAQIKYRQTSRPVEYLVLIDQVNPENQQFRLFQQWVQLLEKEDVLIEHFIYRTNPYTVWNAEHPEGLTLAQLHQLYPTHRLIIFGDGRNLIDPFQVKILDATEKAFNMWPQRALLTPVDPRKWTYKEKLLQRLFVLLPADLQGQLMLVEEITQESKVDFNALHKALTTGPTKRVASIPDRISTQSAKKLKHLFPDTLYTWLIATMVYPNPTWEILLAVGHALTPLLCKDSSQTLVNYNNILLLSQLPWLKTGAIPDKLRDQFLLELDQLDPVIEQAARRAVLDVLIAARDNLRQVVNEAYVEHDLNKEITLQRAALDSTNKQVQRELQFLLDNNKIDPKYSAFLDADSSEIPRELRLAIRLCIAYLFLVLFFGIISFDYLRLPVSTLTDTILVEPINRQAVPDSTIQAYNRLVREYNHGVYRYGQDSLSDAIENFRIVSVSPDSMFRNDALHGIGLSWFYLNNLDSAAHYRDLLETGYYAAFGTPNLAVLTIQPDEEDADVDPLDDVDLEPIDEELGPFYAEVSPVLVNNRRLVRDSTGLYGYLDGEDNVAIDFQFAAARDFTDGRAFVQRDSGSPFFIDTSNVVLNLYDRIYTLQDNLIRVEKDGLFGYINSDGSEVIPLQYDLATDFLDGFADVEVNGTQFQIDLGGRRQSLSLVIDSLVHIARNSDEFDNEIEDIAFSPDGSIIATADDLGYIRLWNTNTNTLVNEWQINAKDIAYTLKFTPDGEYIAVGSEGPIVELWDIDNEELIRQYGGHVDGVGNIGFSPDGNLLITGSWSGIVRLWDMLSGQEVLRLDSHDVNVGVAFSPDGRFIAYGLPGGGISLVDIVSGDEFATFSTGSITYIEVSLDGRYLIAANNDSASLEVWDIQTTTLLRSFDIYIFRADIAISPDSRMVLGPTGEEGAKVSVWDIATGQLVQELGEDKDIYDSTDHIESITFSPDGRILATAAGQKTILWNWPLIASQVGGPNDSGGDSQANTTNNTGGALISGLDIRLYSEEIINGVTSAFDATSTYVAFTNDSQSFVHVMRNGRIDIRDLNGTPIVAYSPDTAKNLVEAIALSPDNNQLAISFSDGIIILYSFPELIPITELKGGATSLKFSPDNQFLVSGMGGTGVTIWDLQSFVASQRFEGDVSSIDISNDGLFIAYSDWSKNNVSILSYNQSTGEFESLHMLEDPYDNTSSVKFADYSNYIVWGADTRGGELDRDITIYDFRQNSPIGFLRSHSNGVYAIETYGNVIITDGLGYRSGEGERVQGLPQGPVRLLRFFDLASFTELEVNVEIPSESILAISPDGRWLYAGNRIWEITYTYRE